MGFTAQVNVVGDQRYSVSISLHNEATATLVRTEQDSMLLRMPNARIKGAIKQKVLLTFNSIDDAMASDGGFTGSHLAVSPLSLCELSLNLIKANKAGEGLADKHSAI